MQRVTGIPATTISRLERGKLAMNQIRMELLSEAYGVVFVVSNGESWIERRDGGAGFSEEELRVRFPQIDWSTPIQVTDGTARRWACRYCIAKHGVTEEQGVFPTKREALQHIREQHG